MMGVRKGHSDPIFIKALVHGKVAPIPAVRVIASDRPGGG
jgi:hypothetical protein